MPDVRIAPGRVEDVPAILALIKALAAYEKLADQVTATEDDIRRELFGPKPSAEALIAHGDGVPIGMAIYVHNFSTFLGRRGLYLEDLFVVPEWRGRGVGSRLLAQVAATALKRECGRVDWSVLDWNEPALGFYRRIGAQVMDEWRICRLTGDALVRLGSQGA